MVDISDIYAILQRIAHRKSAHSMKVIQVKDGRPVLFRKNTSHGLRWFIQITSTDGWSHHYPLHRLERPRLRLLDGAPKEEVVEVALAWARHNGHQNFHISWQDLQEGLLRK